MKTRSIILSILLVLLIFFSTYIIFIKIEKPVDPKDIKTLDDKKKTTKKTDQKVEKNEKNEKAENKDKKDNDEKKEKEENLLIQSINQTIIKKYISIRDFITIKRKTSMMILILLILMSGFIIYLISILFNDPIKKLSGSFNQVQNGDFGVKLPDKGKSSLSRLYRQFNKMIKDLSKKIVIQKYISKSTAEMLENIKTGEFTTGPQRKNITVFFSDIRGFTTFSEKNDPLVVVNRLNELFDIQVKIIARNSGDIDKFVGDAVMAIFPSPQKALNASLNIQKKITEFNKKKKLGLNVGIGINYGEAVVGAVGSGDSYNWTTIGDTVNIASRLCNMAESSTIFISQSVLKKIKTSKRPKERKVKIKGINKPVSVYIIK